MFQVLHFFFPSSENFSVIQEQNRGEFDSLESVADYVVFKELFCPGGPSYFHDFCLIESKRAGRSWSKAEDHLARHCAGTDNDSDKVYGMIQIGLHIQLFTADKGILTRQSNRLHLTKDVDRVTRLFESMKANPIPMAKE